MTSPAPPGRRACAGAAARLERGRRAGDGGQQRPARPRTRRCWARSTAAPRAMPIVVCAAGGLPGELHKLWRTGTPGGYHLEYGFSCMGYEIAGGLGVKMAEPEREVFVLVGDGSYLMLNSELATSVMLGLKLTVVRARQPRLRLHQPAAARDCGGASFNNLFDHVDHMSRSGAGRLRGPCPRARRRGREGRRHRRARAGARARQGGGPELRDRDRHRPPGHHRGGRRLVGCGGARDVRARECAPGARGLRAALARQKLA